MKRISALVSIVTYTALYTSAFRTLSYCPSGCITCLEITIGQDILIQAFYFSCDSDSVGCTFYCKCLSETVIRIYQSDIVSIPNYVYFFSRAICIIDLRIAEQVSCKSLVRIEYNFTCLCADAFYCQILFDFFC